MPDLHTVFVIIVSAWCLLCSPQVRGATGQLELRVVDDDTGQPLTARVHLSDNRGRVRHVRGLSRFADHFVVAGSAVLKLPPGTYRFRVARGLEYRTVSGGFVIQRGAADTKTVRLPRFTDMSSQGWWSGDLFVQRSGTDLDDFIDAEDLHVAAVFPAQQAPDNTPTAADTDNAATGLRCQDTVCVDHRNVAVDVGGGRLNCYRIERPLDVTADTSEFPPSLDYVKSVRRQPAALLAAGWASAWDLPLWLATGHVHCMMVVGPEHFGLDLPGKPRNKRAFPGRRGVMRWHEAVYFQQLNAGSRLAPVAGSGSGALPVPLGANRVYVHIDGPFQYASWWENLLVGRVMVTNGPLLIPRVNGQLPGHTFRGPAGGKITLNIALTMHTAVEVPYLEIVKNGRVVREVMLDEWARQNGRLPTIEFEESGWMLIRVATLDDDHYRVAMTGPYFVQIGAADGVRRKAAEFFQAWEYQRASLLHRSGDPHLSRIMPAHRKAHEYWKERAAAAKIE